MADPRFVLVKSVSPHNGGNFRRAGLRFTRDWRPLEVAAKPDLDKGVIDDEILKALQAETFLAVKPATTEEVARLADARLDASRDKDSELAELRTKNAELEARLMRLEVGGKPGADTAELDALRAKNAELEARVAALGDLEARLKRLESAPTAAAPPPTAPATPPTAPAANDKGGKPAGK